jgi:NAD(P)-dependent dehydrogenase (short-subunit alcohol dehydrogenase family)
MGTKRKVAVIMGASQGIGAALVKAYRDRNYRVVPTARSIKPLSGDDVAVVSSDITDRSTAERVISEGMLRFGRIDTLFSNAGIFIAKPFSSTPRPITSRWWASTSPASFPFRTQNGTALLSLLRETTSGRCVALQSRSSSIPYEIFRRCSK